MSRTPRASFMRDEFERILQRVAESRGTRRDPVPALDGLPLTGVSISAAAPPPMGDGERAFRLEQWVDRAETWHAVNDRISLDVHGSAAMTHIDALSHFGRPDLAPSDDVRALRDGIVGRGVLIDLPALLGRSIRAGEAATPSMLADALDAQQVGIHPGDTIWIRLRRTTDAEPRTPSAEVADEAAPGVSFACAEQIASWAPAAIVTDAGMDPFPSEVAEIPVPWHILLLTALRVPLVDFADLDRVSAECRERRRWEFVSVLAPLPLPGASGSPVNPLALF
ncbi:cyclase family protein [Microbacterium sp. SLBN-111]|uniref:cyclase family protein n=1 Tax=Microbacterium sp. SLBN-111 TaxID=3377733 RepID=UPI003C72FD99